MNPIEYALWLKTLPLEEQKTLFRAAFKNYVRVGEPILDSAYGKAVAVERGFGTPKGHQ